jgi:hypothetical protein
MTQNNKISPSTEIKPKEQLKEKIKLLRDELEFGDQRLIAESCKETLRNVRECISGLNITSTDRALKIFNAMQQLIDERKKNVLKAVA